MAYENFIPTVWNEGIERELSRLCVFAEDCNTRYEGSVKEKGEAVKILGVARPTIRSLSRAEAAGDIAAPEEIEDTSALLYINQIRYFNYLVGDIDRAQAVCGLMDALGTETSEALAEEIDAYLAGFALDSAVKKLYKTAPKVVAGTPATGEKNVLHVLDEAVEELYKNDVHGNSELVVTVSPRFYTLMKQSGLEKTTDNTGIFQNGRVGRYGGVTVKMSNHVKTGTTTASGDTDHILIRTRRALAFAKPLTHTEPYRPEKKFADAVKGFVLFDAKVVRPREILDINVKY